MIQFKNIPMSLYEIAASFANTKFKVLELTEFNTKAYELTLSLVNEEDAKIFILFDQDTISFAVGETYSDYYSEYRPWDNTIQTIETFDAFYQQHFFECG